MKAPATARMEQDTVWQTEVAMVVGDGSYLLALELVDVHDVVTRVGRAERHSRVHHTLLMLLLMLTQRRWRVAPAPLADRLQGLIARWRVVLVGVVGIGGDGRRRPNGTLRRLQDRRSKPAVAT